MIQGKSSLIRASYFSLLVVICSSFGVQAQSSAAATHHELVQQARNMRMESKPAVSAELWERALELNPNDGSNWTQYGHVLMELKAYRKAITSYEKALELGSGYPWESLYNISRCYMLAGDKQQALHYLERTLNSGYRNLKMIRANLEFAALRDDPRFRDLLAIVDVKRMSRDEGWRYDLQFLVREIKRLHYDPFRRVGREAFEAYAGKLHDEIPGMTEPQIVAGLMRLVAMAGDGHTLIRHPAFSQQGKKLLPVQFYYFTEGLFITAAAPEYAELAGARVTKIGGHEVDKIMEALDPLISQDNLMWPKLIAPGLMRSPYLLHGLGLITEADNVFITFRDAGANERTVNLQGVAGAADETWVLARKQKAGTEPLYLRNRRAPYWFEYIPEQKLVWLQYNAIANDRKDNFPDFCNRIFKFIDENDVDKLVVDMRWNGGGNTFLSQPLVHGLIGNRKINQRGKLFIIVGRNTFSAAMNTATLIERHTNAIFAGEPTGSSPNFIGESVDFELPYSGMTGSISDLYWQSSWPMDHRPWIPPLLYAPPSFADYVQGRDPAFEAILQYREP